MSKWLLLCYLGILVFLSLNPWLKPSSAPAMGILSWDLVDHAIAYAGLAIVTILASRDRIRGWALLALAALFPSLVGILNEFCQSWFTTTRTFSYFDAYANCFGALMGSALFWSYQAISGVASASWKRPLRRGR